jgi:hypothetical protein
MGLYHKNRSIKGPNGENIQIPKGTSAKKGIAPLRGSVIPVVKGGLTKPAQAQKHPHRKDITLPPTVAGAAQLHADSLGMSDQDYYNGAVVAFFSKMLTGDHTLTEPAEACPTCGLKGNKFTKPNAPAESGFKRVRVGVRFTENVAKMLFQLAEDWFGGTWSHAFENAVRSYLGKRNPPPEGEGRVAGAKLPVGRPRRGDTAEAKLMRALGVGEPAPQ